MFRKKKSPFELFIEELTAVLTKHGFSKQMNINADMQQITLYPVFISYLIASLDEKLTYTPYKDPSKQNIFSPNNSNSRLVIKLYFMEEGMLDRSCDALHRKYPEIQLNREKNSVTEIHADIQGLRNLLPNFDVFLQANFSFNLSHRKAAHQISSVHEILDSISKPKKIDSRAHWAEEATLVLVDQLTGELNLLEPDYTIPATISTLNTALLLCLIPPLADVVIQYLTSPNTISIKFSREYLAHLGPSYHNGDLVAIRNNSIPSKMPDRYLRILNFFNQLKNSKQGVSTQCYVAENCVTVPHDILFDPKFIQNLKNIFDHLPAEKIAAYQKLCGTYSNVPEPSPTAGKSTTDVLRGLDHKVVAGSDESKGKQPSAATSHTMVATNSTPVSLVPTDNAAHHPDDSKQDPNGKHIPPQPDAQQYRSKPKDQQCRIC